VTIRNASAKVLDADAEFDRAMRQYFRQVERRAWHRRLSIVAALLVISLAANMSQLWLYMEALKVCGVRP